MRRILLASLVCLSSVAATAADWRLSGYVETSATTRDASRLSRGDRPSANLNRFGFYSDLVYDAKTGKWFALSDRGPGGGCFAGTVLPVLLLGIVTGPVIQLFMLVAAHLRTYGACRCTCRGAAAPATDVGTAG